MNTMISLGPLSIPSEVLTGFLALLAGFAAVTTAGRRQPETRKHIIDRLLTGVIIFVLLWKVSPALTNPGSMIRQPMLLLYAPTRTVHLLIALAGFLLYTLRIYLKEGKDKSLLKFFLLFVFVSASVFAVIHFVLPATGSPSEDTAASESELPSPGRSAPDFTLETMDGAFISLSDYKGGPVILNFWASWCPPCKAEIPELIHFYDGNRTDAVLLSVNMTSSERDLPTVKAFILKQGIEFPVLLDLSGALAGRYGVTSIPTTFIIDGEGTVMRLRSGAVTSGWIENALLNR